MSKKLNETYERMNKYKKYGRKYFFADYMIIQNKEILRMCNAIIECFEETIIKIYTFTLCAILYVPLFVSALIIRFYVSVILFFKFDKYKFEKEYTEFCKKYGYDYEGDFTNDNK